MKKPLVFSSLFGNTIGNKTKSGHSPSAINARRKKKRGRIARIEELEGREMLNAAAWNALINYGIFDESDVYTDHQFVEVSSEADLRNHLELDAEDDSHADIIVVSGTINLTDGALLVDSNVIIVGMGTTGAVIDGQGTDRVFQVRSGEVVLAGLTITGGNTQGEVSEYNAGAGGGIQQIGGNLTIANSLIVGNTAGTHGGGIYSVGTGGTLTIANSLVAHNSANNGGGGGVYAGFEGAGTFNLYGSTVAGNTATQEGGGVNIRGDVTMNIYNSIVIDNVSTSNSAEGDIALAGVNSVGRAYNNIIGQTNTHGPTHIFADGPNRQDNLYGQTVGYVQFEDRESYRLSDNSPAGTAGISEYLFGKVDLAGNTRSDEPSIGAYEGGFAAVENLQARVILATGIELSWSQGRGALGYVLQYRAADSETWITAGTLTDRSITHFEFTGLQPGTEYDFRVIAYREGEPGAGWDGNDNSENSQSATLSGVTTVLERVSPDLTWGEPARTQNTITVNWNAPNATRYIIEYKRSRDDWDDAEVIILSGSHHSSIFLTGLDSNTLYDIRIRPANADYPDGNPENSWSVISIRTLGDPNVEIPTGIVTGFTILQKTSNSATLTWNDLPGMVSYEIEYRRVGSNDDWSLRVEVDQGTRIAIITGLSANTMYEFRIYAVNAGGVSPNFASTEGRMEKEEGTGPGFGVSFNLSAENITANSFTLRWTAPGTLSADTWYEIRYQAAGSTEWTTFYNYEWDHGVGERDFTGLQPDTRYFFEFWVINGRGEAIRDIAVLTLIATPAPFDATPAAPANNPSTTTTSVLLTWPTEPESGLQYELRYKAVHETTWIVETSQIIIHAGYADIPGFMFNTEYLFELRAYREGTNPNTSDWATVGTTTNINQGVLPPPAPTWPTDHYSATSPSTGTLTWNASERAQSYRIILTPFGGEEESAVFYSLEASVELTGLVHGTQYSVRVTAIGAGGDSPESALELFSHNFSLDTLPDTLVPAPTVAVTQDGVDSLLVSWNQIPAASGYMVYYATSATELAAVVSDNPNGGVPAGNATSLRLTDLEQGATYYIQVIAFSLAEKSEPSNMVWITVDGSVFGLTQPEIVSVRGVTTSMLEVVWTKEPNVPVDAVSYKIEYSSDGGQTWTSAVFAPSPSGQVARNVQLGEILWGEHTRPDGKEYYAYVISGLELNTTYQVRVTAEAAGYDSKSDVYGDGVDVNGIATSEETGNRTLSANEAATNKGNKQFRKVSVGSFAKAAGINFLGLRMTVNNNVRNSCNEVYKVEIFVRNANTQNAAPIQVVYVTADLLRDHLGRVDSGTGTFRPVLQIGVPGTATLNVTYRFAVTAIAADDTQHGDRESATRAERNKITVGNAKTLTARQATPTISTTPNSVTPGSLQLRWAAPKTGVDGYEITIQGRVNNQNNQTIAILIIKFDGSGRAMITDVLAANRVPITEATPSGNVPLDLQTLLSLKNMSHTHPDYPFDYWTARPGNASLETPWMGLTIEGLLPGQRYRFEMRSIDAEQGTRVNNDTLRHGVNSTDVVSRVTVTVPRYTAVTASVNRLTGLVTLTTPRPPSVPKSRPADINGQPGVLHSNQHFYDQAVERRATFWDNYTNFEIKVYLRDDYLANYKNGNANNLAANGYTGANRVAVVGVGEASGQNAAGQVTRPPESGAMQSTSERSQDIQLQGLTANRYVVVIQAVHGTQPNLRSVDRVINITVPANHNVPPVSYV